MIYHHTSEYLQFFTTITWNSCWTNKFWRMALLNWITVFENCRAANWGCIYPSPWRHNYHFKKIKWIKIKTGMSLVYCKSLVGKTDTKGTVQSETMYLTLDLTTISLGGKMDVSRNSDDYQVWYELLQPFPFRGQVELKMSMLNVYTGYQVL